MKFAVVIVHSPENAALAKAVAPGWHAYTEKQGYDLVIRRRPLANYLVNDLMFVYAMLTHYDGILMCDADVAVTNIDTDLLRLAKCALNISREIEGRARVNGGVTLWINREETWLMLQELIASRDTWLKDARGPYWQFYLGDLIEAKKAPCAVWDAEPSIFCSTDQLGDWHWSDGDFIFHALGGTIESKLERLQPYLTKCTC